MTLIDSSQVKIPKKTENKRNKVIVEILKLNAMTVNTAVPNKILEILEECENQGSLVIDLFKKAQHEGLRKIYVFNLL